MVRPILEQVAEQIRENKYIKPILFLITEDRSVIHTLLERGDCFELLAENQPGTTAYQKGEQYVNLIFAPSLKDMSKRLEQKGPGYVVVPDWQLLDGQNGLTDKQTNTIVDFIKKWETLPEEERSLKNLILISANAPGTTVPEGYSQYVQVIDVPLIGMYEIGEMVVQVQNQVLGKLPGGKMLTLSEYLKKPDPYTDLLKGMSRAQIQYVLNSLTTGLGRCTAAGLPAQYSTPEKRGELERSARKLIFRLKEQAVAMDGLISYLDTEGITRPGGMEGLESWLRQAKRVLDEPERAEAYAVKFPKGILLAGLPGSGKSLLAKYVANILEIPLIQFKMSAVMNENVGGTEAKLGRVLKLIEASAPCVVWIDEIEKELPSKDDSGKGDSGVSKRCLATILNWMQENKKQCFICATANHIGSLPSELLRRGRFDRKYYTFLPMQRQCTQILITHLKKAAGEAPGLFDKSVFDRNAKEAENEKKLEAICEKAFEKIAAMKRKFFTGADLEGLVQDVKMMLFQSSDDHLPCSAEKLTELLVYAAQKSKPYGETNFPETVEYWCDMQKNPFLNVGVPEPAGVPGEEKGQQKKNGIYDFIPFDFTDLHFDGSTWSWRDGLNCVSDRKYDQNMFKELKDPILQQMNLRAGKR